jgi:O-antigen/teichoic acid export membrane protein
MLNKLKLKSEFSKNVLTLMTGTTVAQAIPIAISPILTRIYTPEDFGIFALYIGIVSLLSVFATGRYELAIMLPKKDRDAFNVFILAIFISIVFSVILLLAILVFHTKIVELLNNKEIEPWLYIIPLSVLLSGLYQSVHYWINRNKEYKLMSSSIILQSSSNATFNTSFGFLGLSSVGLILTNIITKFIALFYVVVKQKKLFLNIKYISFTQSKILSLKYKQFPLHTLPQNFIYQGSLQLPIFFIQQAFSVTVLGAFSLAYRVLVTPLSIIGNSLGEVYYQKASQMYLEDKVALYQYTKNMFFKLFLVSVSVGGLVVWFLPSIFSFVFGQTWVVAGEISQYLMIYLIVDFALTPFSKIYLISNNNIFYLKWEIVRFLLLLLFFIVAFKSLKTIESFFLYFSLIHLILYIYIIIPIVNVKSFIWRHQFEKST